MSGKTEKPKELGPKERFLSGNGMPVNSVTPDQIEHLMKLMVTHKIEEFSVGGMRIVKKIHEFPEVKPTHRQEPTEDELLFHSAQ